jgi:hypothetical protein
VGVVGVTVTSKDWDFWAAGAYAASPGWSARSVQVPPPTKVTVDPLTVHTEVVALETVTVSPEVAEAVTVYVAPPVAAFVGAADVKVMVWVALATVNVCDFGAAAAQAALPGWLATTVQLPLPMRLTVDPFTVQTEVVPDEKATARPDVALAVIV